MAGYGNRNCPARLPARLCDETRGPRLRSGNPAVEHTYAAPNATGGGTGDDRARRECGSRDRAIRAEHDGEGGGKPRLLKIPRQAREAIRSRVTDAPTKHGICTDDRELQRLRNSYEAVRLSLGAARGVRFAEQHDGSAHVEFGDGCYQTSSLTVGSKLKEGRRPVWTRSCIGSQETKAIVRPVALSCRTASRTAIRVG